MKPEVETKWFEIIIISYFALQVLQPKESSLGTKCPGAGERGILSAGRNHRTEEFQAAQQKLVKHLQAPSWSGGEEAREKGEGDEGVRR